MMMMITAFGETNFPAATTIKVILTITENDQKTYSMVFKEQNHAGRVIVDQHATVNMYLSFDVRLIITSRISWYKCVSVSVFNIRFYSGNYTVCCRALQLMQFLSFSLHHLIVHHYQLQYHLAARVYLVLAPRQYV